MLSSNHYPSGHYSSNMIHIPMKKTKNPKNQKSTNITYPSDGGNLSSISVNFKAGIILPL